MKRSCVMALLTALVLSLGTALRADDAVPAAQGLTDPTLAFGLSGVAPWSPAMPFLDLVKSMRPLMAKAKGDAGMTNAELAAGGWLDAKGWPKAIPPGMTDLRTIWDWSTSKADPILAASRAGTYLLTYQGQGQIKFSGSAKILEAEPGRIRFENRSGGTMTLQILQTDPARTGDHLRDIVIVKEKYETLLAMGQIFNPDWLEIIQDARQLRFMDWMKANGSEVVDWAERAEVTDAVWTGEAGVPLEVMVELANQTGTEPWFNLPVGASDDYIRRFATQVRDQLNPGLKVHVELGNETWNNALPGFHALDRMSQADWGVRAPMDYYAKRATEMAVIWKEVFGPESKARVNAVLGAQTMNINVATRALRAPQWQTHEPDSYVDPASVIDSIAVTTYFGGSHMKNAALRAELLAALADPGLDAEAWFKGRLMDPDVQGSIPQIMAAWDRHRALADQYGLDLVAYEGGQHLLHAFKVRGITPAEMDKLVAFMARFIRSQAMADLYLDLWKAWTRVSDGPFMQFGDVSIVSKFGAWGIFSSLGDISPRAELLMELNATTKAWFGPGGGPAYQQGVTRVAGAAAARLMGTDRGDYLIGGAGDDIITPGRGKDAIAGEGGSDTLVLLGLASDYSLTPEGRDHRLAGPGSSALLRGIEILRFSDGQERRLDTLLRD